MQSTSVNTANSRKTCPTCGEQTKTAFLDGTCGECAVYNSYLRDPNPAHYTFEAKLDLSRRAKRLAKGIGIDEDGKKWYLDENCNPSPFGRCFE